MAAPTKSAEAYLSPEQVAEMLPGVSERNLREMRHLGGGPVFSKPTPKVVLYLKSDVEAWVAAGRHERTDRPVAA